MAHSQEEQDAAEKAVNAFSRLSQENDSLINQLDSLKRAYDLVLAENESLRKELTRNKRQRDRYLKACTAMRAHLSSLGAAFVEAVKSADLEIYGSNGDNGDNGKPAARPQGLPPVDQLPTFLKGIPQH